MDLRIGMLEIVASSKPSTIGCSHRQNSSGESAKPSPAGRVGHRARARDALRILGLCYPPATSKRRTAGPNFGPKLPDTHRNPKGRNLEPVAATPYDKTPFGTRRDVPIRASSNFKTGAFSRGLAEPRSQVRNMLFRIDVLDPGHFSSVVSIVPPKLRQSRIGCAARGEGW
jgi:hypothetical protein